MNRMIICWSYHRCIYIHRIHHIHTETSLVLDCWSFMGSFDVIHWLFTDEFIPTPSHPILIPDFFNSLSVDLMQFTEIFETNLYMNTHTRFSHQIVEVIIDCPNIFHWIFWGEFVHVYSRIHINSCAILIPDCWSYCQRSWCNSLKVSRWIYPMIAIPTGASQCFLQTSRHDLCIHIYIYIYIYI